MLKYIKKEKEIEFKKYQHICRLGTSDTVGILNGVCHIQPKIDGTNGSLWLDNEGNVCAGSRRRQLDTHQDNQGFYNTYVKDERFIEYFKEHPNHRIFGEYLRPHTIRTYKDNAWDKFYVFDVCIDDGDELKYLTYEEYKPLLEKYEIDYIPVIATLDNPTEDELKELLKRNTYLIEDHCGVGEGIVIKRYDFVNQYGRIVWAKLVNEEFNNKPIKNKKLIRDNDIPVEIRTVEKYITEAVIKKEYAKILNDNTSEKAVIPKLINTVYYTFITEEMWNTVKEFKNPTINFKEVQNKIRDKIREVMPDLFVKRG